MATANTGVIMAAAALLAACPTEPGADPDAGPEAPRDGTYAIDGALAGDTPAFTSGLWAYVDGEVLLYAASDIDDTCATFADRAEQIVAARALPAADRPAAYAEADAATLPAQFWAVRVFLRGVEEGAAFEPPYDVRHDDVVDVELEHALDHPDWELIAIGDLAGKNSEEFVPAPGTQDVAPGAVTALAVDWEARAELAADVEMRAFVGDGTVFPIGLTMDVARCGAVEDALADDPDALGTVF